MAGYVHRPEHSAWMREPWTCPKCGKTMGLGGKPAHVRFCGEDEEARFWSRVDKTSSADGCWLWTAGTDKWGYGDLRYKKKHIQAHRLAWKLLRGDPEKMDCLHTCHNPTCCNPDHLYLGTDLENAQDRVKAGRHVRGAESYNTHLTDDDVREMRRRREELGTTYGELGKAFGVSYVAALNICKRKSWAHVS